MDFKQYQTTAHTTSRNTEICGDRRLYPVLGLSGESGEISEKFKKLFRDKNGVANEEFVDLIEKELGDVLWYVAEICTQMGLDMDKIADKNIEKLLSRKERGQIQGSGDNR
jgi:NTP pyrophosphatase (non-canonical NTP hydrolase)